MKKKIIAKSPALYETYERKPGSDKTNTHYCPGCGHGIIHKLIAEALEELGMAERTVFLSPVGCSVFGYYYFDCGNLQCAHGRAPAAGTGVTRANPDNYVVSYQGDGDLAAIGTAEIIHAANRGEKMTVFFVNNSIYGMTGGQMAPTSLVGQKTTTSPYGRSLANEGAPIRVVELLGALDAPVYLTRVSTHDIKHVMKTRQAIRKALQAQRDGLGFSLVEILSFCPSGWKVNPMHCKEWTEKHVLPVFPLVTVRDETATRPPRAAAPRRADAAELTTLLELQGEEPHAQARPGCFDSLRLLAAGYGGQGIMLLGEMLAGIGMNHGFHVTWLPSYGPEMRGGTANCSVVIARDPIGTPVVDVPAVLVAMNQLSYEKFSHLVPAGGTIFCNSSLVTAERVPPGVKIVPVPASDLAKTAGNERAANIVMLGALLALFPYFEETVIEYVLARQFTRPEMLELNRKALAAGRDVAAAHT